MAPRLVYLDLKTTGYESQEIIQVSNSIWEISTQVEGYYYTTCAVVKQMEVVKNPQLVDNCTCGTILFPLYRYFPGLIKKTFKVHSYYVNSVGPLHTMRFLAWAKGFQVLVSFYVVILVSQNFAQPR